MYEEVVYIAEDGHYIREMDVRKRHKHRELPPKIIEWLGGSPREVGQWLVDKDMTEDVLFHRRIYTPYTIRNNREPLTVKAIRKEVARITRAEPARREF